MSTYHPRIVAQALEDLESALTRWSSVTSDMLATATTTQIHATEAVDRAWHRAAISLDNAKDDEESVERALATVATSADKCFNATVNAQKTLKESQQAFSEAEATLQKWQAELKKALAWLARAKERLEKAIQEYNRAVAALRSAISDLDRAESRLRACLNDDRRRDCSGEAAAVRRAMDQVARAQEWVKITESEVIAAQEEVKRAQARVACCEKAVTFSMEAVSIAQESVNIATEALNSAERSLEFVQVAESLAHIAEEKMLAEVESAKNAMLDTRSARQLTDDAAILLQTADEAENSAQNYATSVRAELGYRVQRLLDLNRPTILDEGDFTLPSNVSPSEIKIYDRHSDGKTQIIYGNKRDASGQIVGDHGHTVVDRFGDIDFARTQKGTIKKDTGK